MAPPPIVQAATPRVLRAYFRRSYSCCDPAPRTTSPLKPPQYLHHGSSCVHTHVTFSRRESCVPHSPGVLWPVTASRYFPTRNSVVLTFIAWCSGGHRSGFPKPQLRRITPPWLRLWGTALSGTPSCRGHRDWHGTLCGRLSYRGCAMLLRLEAALLAGWWSGSILRI